MGFVEPIVVELEADAVVAHLETPGRQLLYIERHARRLGMLAYVGQRFLDDVQHLDLAVGRQRQALAGDAQRRGDAALVLEFAQGGGERRFDVLGVGAELSITGHSLPLLPDRQIQVLHIVQEALSNVRKHAQATHVWLDVQQQPAWRFAVRDDGVGFKLDDDQLDETHVGLRIMRERAQRIGATLEIVSAPGRGSSIILTLPPQAQAMAPDSTSQGQEVLT